MFISFDVGEKNLAYCIGKLNLTLSIEKIAHHNVIYKKKQTIIESCILVTEILNKEFNLEFSKKSNSKNDVLIIIEQQMRVNVRSQRLSQHLWSYFYVKYPPEMYSICIKFVPSHLKTQHFLGKNNLNCKMRKKWAVAKISELLKNEQILAEINALTKKDDVCDTILQLMAYLKL
jgi:hypothetical protein